MSRMDKLVNELTPKCGCGKPARYYVADNKMACNKVIRCLTYDEAIEALKEANMEILQLKKGIAGLQAVVRELVK